MSKYSSTVVRPIGVQRIYLKVIGTRIVLLYKSSPRINILAVLTSPHPPFSFSSIAPSIDLVLFSHGDLPHIGLYAYAHARWGLRAPAYSSLPVQALGRIAVTEEIESIRAEQDVDLLDVVSRPCIPSAKEVATAFESLITLRYSQPSHLSGLPR